MNRTRGLHTTLTLDSWKNHPSDSEYDSHLALARDFVEIDEVDFDLSTIQYVLIFAVFSFERRVDESN